MDDKHCPFWIGSSTYCLSVSLSVLGCWQTMHWGISLNKHPLWMTSFVCLSIHAKSHAFVFQLTLTRMEAQNSHMNASVMRAYTHVAYIHVTDR